MNDRAELGVICCLGTGEYFIARTLQFAGYAFGHEAFRPQGMVHHLLAAPEGVVVPCPGRRGQRAHTHSARFSRLLHVVRNPLDAVGAFVMARARGWVSTGTLDILERETSARQDQHPYEFALRYWAEWNALCGRTTSTLAHVETFQVSDAWPDSSAMRPFGKDYPTPELPVTWEDLQVFVPGDYLDNVAKLAIRYGYEVDL